MSSLDGLERLGETTIVVVNLWRPFSIRNLCIIPATAQRPWRRTIISYVSIQKIDVDVPLLNGYSEPARIGGDPVTIAAAIICAFLDRWVWGRNGERDVTVMVQCEADIWRERDAREIDKFLKCEMIDFDQKRTNPGTGCACVPRKIERTNS